MCTEILYLLSEHLIHVLILKAYKKKYDIFIHGKVHGLFIHTFILFTLYIII